MDEKDLKDQSAQQDKVQEEYDEEWERMKADEEKEAKKDADSKAGPGPTDTDESRKADEEEEAKKADEEAGKKADDEARKKEEEEKGKTEGEKAYSKEDFEKLEKRFGDTQKWAQTLAQELSDLKKTITDRDKGAATDQQVKDQQKAADDAEKELRDQIEKIKEDYPEMVKPLQAILERMTSLNKTFSEQSKKFSDMEEKRKKEEELEKQHGAALEAFERDVKPKIVEKHTDFDRIVRSEEFYKWASEQRPSLRTAALDSGVPEDIVWALDEFKKSKYGDIFKAQKDKEEKEKDRRIADAQTLRGGSTQHPGKSKKEKDPNDYDGGWSEAGKELEKEGLRA